MNPQERRHLQKLDDLVLNASAEELAKIQEIDHHAQMEGLSFHDVCLDFGCLVNSSIKKPPGRS